MKQSFERSKISIDSVIYYGLLKYKIWIQWEKKLNTYFANQQERKSQPILTCFRKDLLIKFALNLPRVKEEEVLFPLLKIKKILNFLKVAMVEMEEVSFSSPQIKLWISPFSKKKLFMETMGIMEKRIHILFSQGKDGKNGGDLIF